MANDARQATRWARRLVVARDNLAAENERLRAALTSIECHELRDHEDYEAIKDIASAALRQSTHNKGERR